MHQMEPLENSVLEFFVQKRVRTLEIFALI